MRDADLYTFLSQYQQEPIALGGNALNVEWFQYYGTGEKATVRKPDRFDYTVITADTAQKEGELNDYSVLCYWGMYRGKAYFIDGVRGKWEAPALETQFKAFVSQCWNRNKECGTLRKIYVEDKASGTGLIQNCRKAFPIEITPLQRDKDKVTRCMDAQPVIKTVTRKPDRFDYTVITADTAQKEGELNDYSVLCYWGMYRGKAYFIDGVRGKWEAPALETQFKAFVSQCWNRNKECGTLRKIYVEDKASGTGLIQNCRKAFPIEITPLQRDKDKVTRCMDAQPVIKTVTRKPDRFDYTVITADTAQKEGELNDYSVLCYWGMYRGKAYFIDGVRGKWEAPALETQFKAFVSQCWNRNKECGTLRKIYVEDKASGTGLIQNCRKAFPIEITPLQRDKDKVTRCMDAQPVIKTVTRKPDRFDYTVITADTAQKEGELNDYSVLCYWGMYRGKAYFIDGVRGKWEAPALETQFKAFVSQCWNRNKECGTLRKIYVEDKASGTGLIQNCRKAFPIEITPLQRDKDKVTRCMDAQPVIKTVTILPESHHMLNEFLAEAAAFTYDDSHPHDDIMDNLLMWLTSKSTSQQRC
ncbi:terminase large subunit [Citrobacter phage HCF1]|uniref:Terminase large subunit n=1 Tax=Citrobacter phage HCF1 TaxID=2849700 RepID=A0ABX6D496_9CAUD|nr:terminase large subunit [Citrobacter phage HCF1]